MKKSIRGNPILPACFIKAINRRKKEFHLKNGKKKNKCDDIFFNEIKKRGGGEKSTYGQLISTEENKERTSLSLLVQYKQLLVQHNQ